MTDFICAICLTEKININQKIYDYNYVSIIDCKHSFCIDCLRNWIIVSKNHTCPTCRIVIKTVMKKNEFKVFTDSKTLKKDSKKTLKEDSKKTLELFLEKKQYKNNKKNLFYAILLETVMMQY